ncbi:unnamed protein product [Schistosoma margrebowiei]|uniref:Leishmanolysin-like peptidase n=1 Tax=Schistosoma margrebowiei TaxID=48269 RepID=A0A183MIA9_9TREM|nr:unnamed protein product [Schistosoma margrebowiei]
MKAPRPNDHAAQRTKHYQKISSNNRYLNYKQRWIVASSEIRDARFVLFGTRQLDVPASQSRCSLWDSNSVPFASSAMANNTVKKITRTWRSTAGWFTKDFYAFVTPKILNAARKHFNCEQLDGADLENQYQTGLIGSHWERRTYSSEIMAAIIDVDYSVSRVTLSFFEDSGWYIVDYSKAMKWEYGRQLGCDFSMKSCFDYAEIRRQHHRKIIPFCDTVNEARCRDAFSYGRCIIVRYGTPVSKEDRFFLKAPFDTEYPPEYFGGNDPFTDYCPTMAYVKGLGSDYSATSFCTHQENEKLSRIGVNLYYQTYGSNGICVEHRGVWNYTRKHEYTLGTFLKGSCHKYKCYNDGTLGLYFKDSTVNCTRKDEPVRFDVSDGESRLNGKILCPNVNRFCRVRLLCICIKYKK